MKITKQLITAVMVASVSTLGGSLGLAGVAAAQSATSATSQQRLQTIISKGDQEITRRLSTLTNKINAATKLSASDKTTLSGEVSDTISGLNTLKTKLDAETTIAAARTDVQDIYTEYRVYALVAPKVNLIKVADDQQAAEAKLTALAQKLQTRIATAQQAGKDVSALQSQLSDMTTNVSAAQAISSGIESKVISLQPSDFNSDHALLSGDSAQLKTAHADNKQAYNDAKSIIATLKTLK